jgi:hypothetical protein
MKNDKIYRQVAIEAVKEASLGETEVPRLTRRILDYLERQEPAEPEQHLTCKGCVHLGDDYKLPCTSCRRNPALLDRYEAEGVAI